MNEQLIWKGKSSQLINFKIYLLGSLVAYWSFVGMANTFGMVIGTFALLKMAHSWLQTHYDVYTITTDRIIREEGIIHRVTYDIELHRVQDVLLHEPIWYRVFGLGNIRLLSTQVTSHEFYLQAIPKPKYLREALRGRAIDSNTIYYPSLDGYSTGNRHYLN